MLTQVFASAVFGIDAVPITIEVHIDAGIGYHLVGLPDNAVKESNYRIAAALTNTNSTDTSCKTARRICLLYPSIRGR